MNTNNSNTNVTIVVEHHSAWTLLKHMAGSINKAAAKTDAAIYGTKVTVEPVKPPTFSESHPILTGVGGLILGVVFVLAIFATLSFKNENGKTDWWPWLTP